MEYIQLEKLLGIKKHLRKAFQRALEKVYDDPELLVKSFIQFEREEGSLEAFEHCKKLCRIKMEKVGASKAKNDSKKTDEEQARLDKIEKKKEKDKQYRRDKRQQTAADKRAVNGNTQEKGNERFPMFRKPNVPDLAGDVTKKNIAPPPGFTGKKPIAPPPGFNENMKRTIAPPPGFKEPLPKKQKSEEFDNLSEAAQKKLRTVFLSNLDYTVGDDDVKDVMSSSGVILDVRLIKKPNGQSKGYAFVDFEDEVGAATALIKTDNMQLKTKEIHVALSNPPKRDEGPNQSDVRSLGGTESAEFGPRGKGRTQVAFTPRSISVPAKAPTKLEPMKFVKPGGASVGTPEGPVEGNGTKASKTNDDFRKMLLK